MIAENLEQAGEFLFSGIKPMGEIVNSGIRNYIYILVSFRKYKECT